MPTAQAKVLFTILSSFFFLQLFCDFDYWSLKEGDYHCSCDLSSTGNEKNTLLIHFKSKLDTFLKDLNKF